MSLGYIKWFDSKKGYGFIEPEDGGKDVFAHVTQFNNMEARFLKDGQKVSYEIYMDRGRIAAGNITILQCFGWTERQRRNTHVLRLCCIYCISYKKLSLSGVEGTDVIRHRVMPTGFGPLALPLLQNLPFYRGYLLYRGKQPMNGRNTFVTKKTRIAEVCGYIKAKNIIGGGMKLLY